MMYFSSTSRFVVVVVLYYYNICFKNKKWGEHIRVSSLLVFHGADDDDGI